MSYKNKDNFKEIRKISLLLFLYLSQGLPFGFQATALPVYLRTSGVSLSVIGYSTMLAAPWMLKALWSPVVDTKWSLKIGRRKSWIIPLQLLMIISLLTASRSAHMGLLPLMANLFVMNLIAATQDIAVDGLAVDILGEGELGYGNAAQVVGYKGGMIISGGLMVWLSSITGWGNLFIIMSAIAAFPMILILFFREESSCMPAADKMRIGLKDVALYLSSSMKLPSFIWLVIFIATYKSGEIMIDVMFKPFIVDSGFNVSDIGIWVGTYGMAASIAGSAIGGFIASKLTVYRALVYACVMRLFPLIFITALTFTVPLPSLVKCSTILEHFFGGILTTTLFAFMMKNVDRRIGATHYTLLASIEVLGKAPGSFLSGLITDAAGYSFTFVTGTAISFFVIFILPVYHSKISKESI